jgi:hypothetical protein
MPPLIPESAAAGIGITVVLLFLAATVASFVFWLWSLVDSLRYTDAEYAAAGQNKVLWVVLIVLFGALTLLVYVMLPRPALKRVWAA